jgi:agmatinase
MTISAPQNFLGLDPELADYARAKVVVLPVPYDGTSTYGKGADRGPEAFLKASTQVEFFDEELVRSPCEMGIATLPPVDVPEDPAAMVELVLRTARRPVQDGKKLFGIGGEHSISVGLVRAVAERYGRLSVLQIDAHADLRDSYDGTIYNHACVMKRLLDDGHRLVPVGIRAFSREEHDLMRAHGIHAFLGHRIAGQRAWIEEAVARLESPVYVTVDLDGFDPAVLPSTGTPVPGGLDWYTALTLLRRIGESHEVVAADINELKPDPINHHSEFLASKLAYKMMGYFW